MNINVLSFPYYNNNAMNIFTCHHFLIDLYNYRHNYIHIHYVQ